jgi:hypothetical protein
MNRTPLIVSALVCAGFTAALGQQTPRTVTPVLTDVQQRQSYEYPPVTAPGSGLREDAPVGENRQPEWTAQRRFSTTRTYVIPPWEVEVEQWWQGKFPRAGGSEHLFQSEIEIGLPYRFQVDLYENVDRTQEGRWRYGGTQVEARWAFAEWGRIPLNPTLYGEWKFNNVDPDAYELKLLLAEDLAPRWHWGFNLFYEQAISGTRTTEWGFSQAVSYTLIDQKLSAGIEMNFEHTTEAGSRGNPEIEFLLGPSVQWRPTRNTHIDFVPLFGLTHDSPRVEAFIVAGIDFGRAGGEKGAAPVSVRGR